MARLLTPRFALLTAADLGYFTAMGVAVYTLPLYVTGPLHRTEAAAGLAFGSFAVSALVLRPFAGRLTDRIGRRPLLLGGTALAAPPSPSPRWRPVSPRIALRLPAGRGRSRLLRGRVRRTGGYRPAGPPGRSRQPQLARPLPGPGLRSPARRGARAEIVPPTAWLGAAALCALGTIAVACPGRDRHALAHHEHQTDPPGRDRAPAIGLCASLAASGGFLAFAALRAPETGLANPASAVPLRRHRGRVPEPRSPRSPTAYRP